MFFFVSKLEKPILRWDLAPPKFASRLCQNVQLLEQRHDQQRCKIVKKREFPTSGWDRSAAHEPRKKQANPLFWLRISSRNLLRKKTQKQQKHMIFKKAAKSATQKKWKKHAWCPKIKQVHRHTKRAQSNFFVKKSGKNLFFKRQLRAPHENSRKFGKIGSFDNCQSQKKSVISWFLDSGTEILLGKLKVDCCCSFLLWCS